MQTQTHDFLAPFFWKLSKLIKTKKKGRVIFYCYLVLQLKQRTKNTTKFQ
jgi:hypothetical protein